jgi:hypothetical protein
VGLFLFGHDVVSLGHVTGQPSMHAPKLNAMLAQQLLLGTAEGVWAVLTLLYAMVG